MSSRKCATICHISLICDMPLFIYKSKPHGNGPAAMKKDTIDKLIGRIDHIKEEDLQRFFVKLAEQQGFFQQVFEAIQEGLIRYCRKATIRNVAELRANPVPRRTRGLASVATLG